MKKIIIIFISIMLISTVAGCRGISNGTSNVSRSKKVSTNGSTSMEKVIGALSEAFMLKNEGISVTYDPTGSGTGITAAMDETTDIGLSSRSLKNEEKDSLNETVIALDGIAIIVNKTNTVSDLSLKQIGKIAKGEIKNWKEVGGKDAPIVMIGREAGSGTRDGFESIAECKDNAVYAQELTATGAVIAAVNVNENAIGYASLSAVEDIVKTVTVDSVAATEKTVQNGTYKVQRPFIMVTNKNVELSAAVRSFMKFVLDPSNAEIIKNTGIIPAKK